MVGTKGGVFSRHECFVVVKLVQHAYRDVVCDKILNVCLNHALFGVS